MAHDTRCDRLFTELTAYYLNQNEGKKAEVQERITALTAQAADLDTLAQAWPALAQATATAQEALEAKQAELTALNADLDKTGFFPTKHKRDLRHRIDACEEAVAALAKAAEEAEEKQQGYGTMEVLEQSIAAVRRKAERLTAVLEATATARDEDAIRAELNAQPAEAVEETEATAEEVVEEAAEEITEEVTEEAPVEEAAEEVITEEVTDEIPAEEAVEEAVEAPAEETESTEEVPAE